jgi:3-oxoacyl-[acyl-carrier protein] reductase
MNTPSKTASKTESQTESQTEPQTEPQTETHAARVQEHPTPTAQHTAHKTALVTGSSGGIGRAIAQKLALEGYAVAIHYRNSQAKAQQTALELQDWGVQAITVQGDLTDPLHASRVIQETHERLGGLGVLVNNVGNYVFAPLLETSIDQWHDMLDSNLNATFYTCRAALPIMREAQYGRIINLGYAGAENLLARPSMVPYAIAKTGVAILTRSIAKTEVRHGITANIVAPGVIENSLTQPLLEIPAGRLGTLEEVSSAVWYFVSASGYITGQTLEVAGGWNL